MSSRTRQTKLITTIDTALRELERQDNEFIERKGCELCSLQLRLGLLVRRLPKAPRRIRSAAR